MSDRDSHKFFLTFVADPSLYGQEVLPGGPKVARGRHWEPRVDVIEEPHSLLITVEISGVRGDEISLVYSSERNILSIRGSRAESDINTKRIAHQLEISYGAFEREVSLPDVGLRGEEISASFRNGFLYVSIPKL
ncbi:MAG: Hsp20/alpha crystallin family protein [Rhabdochlamydiaceae bacterium]